MHPLEDLLFGLEREDNLFFLLYLQQESPDRLQILSHLKSNEGENMEKGKKIKMLQMQVQNEQQGRMSAQLHLLPLSQMISNIMNHSLTPN